MTRINTIHPQYLTDQYLLAEHRELTRIPNGLFFGKLKFNYAKIAKSYLLGRGHVYFFTDKLSWLFKRYHELYYECLARGFNITYKEVWGFGGLQGTWKYWGDFTPTTDDHRINIERLIERFPKKARYYGKPITLDEYKSMLVEHYKEAM